MSQFLELKSVECSSFFFEVEEQPPQTPDPSFSIENEKERDAGAWRLLPGMFDWKSHSWKPLSLSFSF